MHHKMLCMHMCYVYHNLIFLMRNCSFWGQTFGTSSIWCEMGTVWTGPISSRAKLMSCYVQAKQLVWVPRLTTLKTTWKEDVPTEEEGGKCCSVNIIQVVTGVEVIIASRSKIKGNILQIDGIKFSVMIDTPITMWYVIPQNHKQFYIQVNK